MKQLIILSDINDFNLLDNVTFKKGEPSFIDHFDEVSGYNPVGLANISPHDSKEEKHTKLVEGGIDAAVDALFSQVKNEIAVAIGLSVGGVVLWRAINRGLMVNHLICLSATRLRYENKPPPCHTLLIFGAEDPYRPASSWFLETGIKEKLIKDCGHELYMDKMIFKILDIEIKELFLRKFS